MPTPLEVADALEPELRDAFLAMVNVIEQSVTEEVLIRLLDAGDVQGIINEFGRAVGEAMSSQATSRLRDVYTDAVTQTMSTVLRSSFALDLVSDLVLERIISASSKLFQSVAIDSVLAVRTLLQADYLEGIGVQAAARNIREVVGLLPQHAEAVKNFGNGLKKQGIPDREIGGLVTTYERRLKAYRAENIARTETLAAAEAGRYAGWQELMKREVLQEDRTWVKWIVTEDDRLCPWCAPMEDHPLVRLGTMFVSTHKGFPEGKPENVGPGSKKRRRVLRPDPRSQSRDERGQFSRIRKRDNRDYLDGKLVELKKENAVLHPPLHPQCRCDLVLVFDD